jgi:two-component system response regulator DesR
MMMPTLSTFAPISADFPEPIVLLDCAGALQAVKNISEQSPTTRILMLTGERHPYNFARGLEYGAHGIASKVDSLDDMLTILRCILAGETGILSARMERLVAEYLEAPIPSLSDLEKRVLELVQFGMENSEIARELGYARKTVRNTLNIINQKFGTKNRFQAAALAEELGLIGWPSS